MRLRCAAFEHRGDARLVEGAEAEAALPLGAERRCAHDWPADHCLRDESEQRLGGGPQVGCRHRLPGELDVHAVGGLRTSTT